jgi:hypothetical protein
MAGEVRLLTCIREMPLPNFGRHSIYPEFVHGFPQYDPEHVGLVGRLLALYFPIHYSLMLFVVGFMTQSVALST